MRAPIKFHWKNIHHLYIGIGVMIYAFITSISEYMNILSNNLFILGTYITFDDFIEHTITATTPLRLFTEKILDPMIFAIKNLFKKTQNNNI